MLKRILSTIICVATCLLAGAQDICIINGNIADTNLGNGKKIKKVSLTATDEFGKTTEVAVAKVKKGKYTFKHKQASDAPVLLYNITGFDAGKSIKLFAEPGEVTVNTTSATQPEESTVSGTPANDTYTEYKALLKNQSKESASAVAKLKELHGEEWLQSAEGKSAAKRAEAKETVKAQAQVIKFLIDHNDSPMTPMEIERSLLPKLSPAYAEQMVKTISPRLQEHPYFHSLRNKVLANNLKVGTEVPDITLPLHNGKQVHLSDYRGKYIVLNFWSNDCNKSAEMFAELQKLHDIVSKNKEQFIIISVALENNVAEWEKAIESNITPSSECWLHACDGTGKASLSAELYKATETPKIVLIEPEGHAVSLNMEIDEIIMRVEQILSGDLYYLDQVE